MTIMPRGSRCGAILLAPCASLWTPQRRAGCRHAGFESRTAVIESPAWSW